MIHVIRRSIVVIGASLVALIAAGPSISSASTSAALDDIRRQTAEVRQLTPPADVPLELVDRAGIRGVLERGVSRVGVGRDLAALQRLYATLGLLPALYDLQRSLLDILTAQIDGLYDPRDKRVYLNASSAGFTGRDKIVLAHELAHAIQDQHFNLQQLLPEGPENADRGAAIQALVEGDALLTQLRWGRQYLTPEEKLSLASGAPADASMLASAPLVIRTALSFPYTEGATFVHLLQDRGGHEAVNQAFYEPPQSTEQVLHPEKYVTREGAIPVLMPELAAALPGAWRTIRTNVLGELGLRVLLEQFSNPQVAASGARGWGGDVYAVLDDPAGRTVVAISTLWDTEPEAAEFYNAFVATIPGRFGPGAVRARDEPSLIRWSTPAGAVLAIKTGERVRMIYAPDGLTAEIANAQF